MNKGTTAEQERHTLDLQAHIVKVKRIKRCLQELHENAIEQLDEMDEALEKATQANKPRRVWGDDTRRREKAKQGEG